MIVFRSKRMRSCWRRWAGSSSHVARRGLRLGRAEPDGTFPGSIRDGRRFCARNHSVAARAASHDPVAGGQFRRPGATIVAGRFRSRRGLETLQYTDFRSAVANLWQLVAPGGRFVACVPNALCPFVQGVHQRLTQWIPVAPVEISDLTRNLPGCSALHMRGLTYLQDQSFLPYAASAWGPDITGTPNRIMFAALRE